jgi:cytochrome P450
VAADHSLVPAAVEESLRHDAPTQGLFRTAREDVELHGTVIPAGGRVLVLYGSANRDERCYEDPDTFVVDRRPVDHLAFGSGIHACLGSRLARLEASVALGALVGRARTIELAGDVVRTANPLLRGLEHLPVRLRAR